MLTRLSGARRLLVGRLVALIYLVCVLAPSSALAIGNGHLSAHCLFDDQLLTSIAHQQTSDAPAVSPAASQHDHSNPPAASMHQHHHNHGAPIATTSTEHEPAQHQHPAIDLQCCGMLCVAALPAAISDVATPTPTLAFALPESGRHLADNLPARHYRPPIA
jgi:hypothetical protein